MRFSNSRNRWSLGIGLALLGLASPQVLGEESESRRGWHGETMPAGLERGATEGEYLWARDGSVMVFVPEGPFQQGSEAGDSDEQPVRTVHLSAFYIDKYEVTWKQWRLSGLPLPKDIDGGPIKPSKPFWGRGDELPVTYIDWHDAMSYMEWVGKRLPTEAEWEKAARGSDGRTFPWGNEPPTFEQAIWNDHPIGKESPASVSCCPEGASPYGLINMAGNAFEWCQDWYDSKYYRRAPDRDPVNLEPGRHRVMRGGSFVFEAEDLRSSLRNRQYPEEGQDYVGFRSVLSLEPVLETQP